jgi:hypothetical protein
MIEIIKTMVDSLRESLTELPSFKAAIVEVSTNGCSSHGTASQRLDAISFKGVHFSFETDTKSRCSLYNGRLMAL